MEMAGSDDPELALEQERADRRESMTHGGSNVAHVGDMREPVTIRDCDPVDSVFRSFLGL